MTLISYDGLRELGITATPYAIRCRVRKGKFPSPVSGGRGWKKMGDGSMRPNAFQWRRSEVVAWLKRKPSTRR
jgi:predicted DNA-binding transcriptional regulator AlpA